MVLFKEKYFFIFEKFYLNLSKKLYEQRGRNRLTDLIRKLWMIKKLPNANKKGLLKNKSPFVHK